MLLFGKHINKYYAKYWWLLLIGVISLLVVDWVQLYIPEIVGDVYRILDVSHDYNELVSCFIKTMLIAITMFFGRMLWRYTIFYASSKMIHQMRSEMFEKATNLSRDYYRTHKVGTIMAWFTNDLENIEEFFGWGTIMIVDALFMSILVLVKMFTLSLLLTLFILLPILLIVVWGLLVEKLMSKKWRERQESFDRLYDFSQENFTGIRVIKAFVKENMEIKAFAKTARKNKEVNIEFAKLSILFDVIITIIIGLISALLFGFGGYFVWCVANGSKPFGLNVNLDAPMLITFYGYFDSLIWPMIALGQIISMRARSKTSLDRVSEFLDTLSPVDDNREGIVFEAVKGEIAFNNFTLKYLTKSFPTVKNITLTIKAGETVGIVGRVGSGKSTLVNSLLYFYNLNEGSVFIDGIDISKCNIKSLRDNISYVPQDNFLFQTSILDNILFSNESLDIESAIEAAKFADVHENILNLSSGYETLTGERGTTLSGGQKQRISIARAFIKNAPIMILDDSVSAVDIKTEETIIDNILKYRKGKTTLIVASRVSTVSKLDKVIVLKDGMLEAFDTPSNLIKTSNTYSKMIRLQELKAERN